MLLESLPSELVLLVLAHVKTWWSKEIAPLTLVSTSYNRLFTPILYRTVVIYKARDLQAFYLFATAEEPWGLLGRLAGYFNVQRRLQRERRQSLLALVHNFSIWDASLFTASDHGIRLLRAILASCPHITNLQVAPTMCAPVVLQGLRPISRLFVCDNIVDAPFLISGGKVAQCLTHLHVMDLRYLALHSDSEESPCRFAASFPRLKVFSTTSEVEAHEYAPKLAAAVQAVLSIPTIQRVNIQITCKSGIDYTESPVYLALHALADPRIFACGVEQPRSALFTAIIQLSLWRRGAIGVEDIWQQGTRVYQQP